MVMETSESFERVWEGLSRAASCCRELGGMTSVNSWYDLSKQLLLIRQKAKLMYNGPALSEVQIHNLVTNMEIAQLAASMVSENG